ncbi:ARM repeat-containing protein [Piedraia hortae CBS 480.64]|uniref:ARM repeat-containing protein n=1 Tax=Piedraia hortae CBS 480.64 TaxID=1314780 RepID=A0A6A7BSH1_9PEZI|nr:ARM repeat-containing protein [Piedraia hortae CBS 480.64]
MSVAPPQSMADVESLVQRLYQPGDPQLISRIDEQLKQIQLSPEGWQVGDALLGSSDSHVRFYAALTFTVKLNKDGAFLDADTAQSIQNRLISWLVRLSRQGENPLVLRKLCSTLTTYFVRTPVLWKRPLLHVAAALQSGTAMAEGDLSPSIDFLSIIRQLPLTDVATLLEFSGTMATEVGRVENCTPAHVHLHGQMEVIVKDASVLMAHAFTGHDSSDSIKTDALRAFVNWIDYAQPIWQNNLEYLGLLRDLVPSAIQCVSDPVIREDALSSFRSILETYTTFFLPQHTLLLAQIITVYVQPALIQALEEGDPAGMPYGQFAIAFGNADTQRLVKNSQDEGPATFLRLLLDVFRAPGYPGVDDELSNLCLDFWDRYADILNESFNGLKEDAELGDNDGAPWIVSAKRILPELVELVWRKMWPPPKETGKQWTDDETEGFVEFRSNVDDLMLSLYICLGSELIQQLIGFTLQCMDAGLWSGVEAALRIINHLAENILEDDSNTTPLDVLFHSSLFRDLTDFAQDIPVHVRKAAIDTLGSFGPYIERHVEYLPDTIRFLLACLDKAPLANAAAKAMESLCSACRSSLTGDLNGFIEQYHRLISSADCETYTKERVITGIAAIIQALQSDSAKVQPLLTLLGTVEVDIQAAKNFAASGAVDMAETAGLSALKCLAGIGKGMQMPEEIPITVDDDDEAVGQPSFWDGPGNVVQARIMSCFSVLAVVGSSGDAIAAACQVLRNGVTETVPGPFVLPASVTADFLQNCNIHTPQLEAVLSLCCAFISRCSKPNAPRPSAEVGSILQQVVAFMRELGHPSQDPALAFSCIELIRNCIPNYIDLLFHPASPLAGQLPFVLDFTLASLGGNEPFPKRVAATLWARLIKPASMVSDQDVRQNLNAVIDAYGPPLSEVLINQISGNAARSELDNLCEPLKALITNKPAARLWLENALMGPSFVQDNQAVVGEQGRHRFLQQLVTLRGDSRKTKEVVKNLWATCRGTVDSF